jgi:Ca2+-dependent lipid-binding protein
MTYPVDSGSCLGVVTIAAIRLPGGDVGETLVSARVDPRVQETEDGLAGAKTSVVEECNDGGGELCEISGSLTVV